MTVKWAERNDIIDAPMKVFDPPEPIKPVTFIPSPMIPTNRGKQRR